MASQRHAIRRQVIELRVSGSAEARRLSPTIAALVEHELVPILDRHFTAASDPARVDRIDRLELDLGRVRPGRLAEDLAAKVEAQLPAALHRCMALAAGGSTASAESVALLLISQFARTGGLPWWSDARKLRALDEAVDAAQRASPAALRALLRSLAANPQPTERLVMHQSDPRLERLLSLLAPTVGALPNQLAPLLAEAPAFAGIGPARLRILLWREAFGAASGGEADEGAVLETLLTRLASAARTRLALLLDDLCAGSIPGELRAPIATLAARFRPPSAADFGPEAELPQLFRRLTSPSLRALLDLLGPLAARLPAAGRAACATALDALSRADIALGDAAVPLAVSALLRPFTRSRLVTMTALRPALAALEQRPENHARSSAAREADAGDDDPARYIENAGLCLLWPFVPRFFARLGLLAANETAFSDEAARHRAIGVLHHVATGELDVPEFWLALNKVLCGLELNAVEEFGPPVTESEAAESARLLAAAIAHAECLGTISVDGFRGSFLLRRGALTTRDGAWLLRVEQQAADVLLERLPWKTEWIRLPWMQAPLRVEW
jgi:hypothetical protein